MAFEDYDVGLAFARIEDELIASMMRNLKRHLREEEKEGFDWSQWQVEQLKYLQEYRQRNRKKFGPQFADINRKMKEAIQEAYENGQKEEELQILESIAGNKKMQRRYANQHASIEAAGDAFFRPNEKKLEALMDATQNDMQKAEQAVLRRSNDQYRKIIFDAQMYANTGAATVEKAVDMATKDFLSRGIDSIVYKNGSRHTISDYADMYIRTAERRATLMGEGRKRQEWGESLVIVNKRGGHPCPKCLEWVGKILVDDVYSGGKPDGKHKFLSEAMAEGLYHPRCKDGHTTYIPGVTSIPDPVTQKEEKEAAKAEAEEQREQLVERQAERQDRLADHSLDPENRMTARHRANQWKEQSAPFTPAKTIEEAQEYAKKFCKQNFMDRTFKGQVDFKGISLEHANAINRSLTEAYTRFPEMEKLSGIKAVAPGSAQGKKAFKSGADALFSYSPVEHGIFINKEVLKNPKTLDAYMQRSKDSWDLVMNNLDKLSGRSKELAERYAKAGRDLVSGDTVEGLFTHELGHHVQWTMLDPKTTNSITSRMNQFAPHLSGYATASNSEYLAESFAAYMKGERDLLDPEYLELLDSKIKALPSDEVSKLRNNIPHGYVDKRVIGAPISKERLQAFLDKAAEKGIRIGADPGSTGNFELYCGDPDVLDEILDRINSNMKEAKRAGLLKQDDDIILIYDNVLGYKGDRSAIDIGAFALTKGKTITLNKFMFDSTKTLIDEYEDALMHELFPRGTSFKNVVDHEFGHILDKHNSFLRKRILAILKENADNDKISLEEYVSKRISMYAAAVDRNGNYTYGELISELYNMLKGTEPDFARELFRKAGVLL